MKRELYIAWYGSGSIRAYFNMYDHVEQIKHRPETITKVVVEKKGNRLVFTPDAHKALENTPTDSHEGKFVIPYPSSEFRSDSLFIDVTKPLTEKELGSDCYEFWSRRVLDKNYYPSVTFMNYEP